MRFGVHVSIGGNIAHAPRRAAALGCECFQIFVANPRGWKKKPVLKRDAAEFRRVVAGEGLGPVVAHVTYLINGATPDRALWERGACAFLAEIATADALGADYFVTHAGSHRGTGHDAGAARLAKLLDRAVREVDPACTICIENESGQANAMGTTFAEIADILGRTRAPARYGVWLDTCHAFVAGYDIATPKGLNAALAELETELGLPRLAGLHVNDAKFTLGSRRDRHEHIGRGMIGGKGLRAFFGDARVRELPAVLETPVEKDGDDARNLAAVRELFKRSRRRKPPKARKPPGARAPARRKK